MTAFGPQKVRIRTVQRLSMIENHFTVCDDKCDMLSRTVNEKSLHRVGRTNEVVWKLRLK